jgi:hypothetical protein
MAVNVDEAGDHILPGRVDDALRPWRPIPSVTENNNKKSLYSWVHSLILTLSRESVVQDPEQSGPTAKVVNPCLQRILVRVLA